MAQFARSLAAVGLVATCALFTGCANFATINRNTELPGEGKDAPAKAIHLDLHQRLVIANGKGKFCSEPSPDGLAAMSSSLGLGVSNQAAESLSTALATSGSSIGLRSQSITLMRDALFRMCEGSMNGDISAAQLARLLARSQELTAVVLAVEQLTGAVAAGQGTVNGLANTNASANQSANKEMLSEMQQTEAALKKQRDDFKATSESKQAARGKTSLDLATAIAEAKLCAPADQVGCTQKIQEKLVADQGAQVEASAAYASFQLAEEKYAFALTTRQTVEKNLAKATLSSGSAVAGAGTSAPIGQRTLSDAAVKDVSKAISDMVGQVLAKDYKAEACIAVLTATVKGDQRETGEIGETRAACLEYFRASLMLDVKRASPR